MADQSTHLMFTRSWKMKVGVSLSLSLTHPLTKAYAGYQMFNTGDFGGHSKPNHYTVFGNFLFQVFS